MYYITSQKKCEFFSSSSSRNELLIACIFRLGQLRQADIASGQFSDRKIFARPVIVRVWNLLSVIYNERQSICLSHSNISYQHSIVCSRELPLHRAAKTRPKGTNQKTAVEINSHDCQHRYFLAVKIYLQTTFMILR